MRSAGTDGNPRNTDKPRSLIQSQPTLNRLKCEGKYKRQKYSRHVGIPNQESRFRKYCNLAAELDSTNPYSVTNAEFCGVSSISVPQESCFSLKIYGLPDFNLSISFLAIIVPRRLFEKLTMSFFQITLACRLIQYVAGLWPMVSGDAGPNAPARLLRIRLDSVCGGLWGYRGLVLAGSCEKSV
jgi:hypothetical protein